MPAGGTDVSASRSSSEAFPQNSNAPTYIIFGDNGGSFGGSDQTANATPTATAVAATGGSAGATGTGGNGAGVPGYGGIPASSGGIGGLSWIEIGIIGAIGALAFWAGKKL